jgi:DNA-binding cell septation regulator SpoVG
MKISDWKPYEGTGGLKGFFRVALDCGLVIKCSLFERENGARWVGMPAKQWTKRNGSIAYEDQVDYIDQKTEERFHDEVFAQLDELRNADNESKPKEGHDSAVVISDEDIPF